MTHGALGQKADSGLFYGNVRLPSGMTGFCVLGEYARLSVRFARHGSVNYPWQKFTFPP